MTNVFEEVRNILFWTSDKVKGSRVRKHLDDIQFILEHPLDKEAEKRKESHLRALLHHASSTVPYYASYKGQDQLNLFPVIDKNTISNNDLLFLSDQFDRTHLHRVSTSGSTGVPFVAWQDIGKRHRQTADNLYFNQRLGFPLGSKLFYLRIWNEINKLGAIERHLKNIVPVEASGLTKEMTDQLLKRLSSDSSRKAMLAYSSTYEALLHSLNELNVQQVQSGLSVMFTMSEALPTNIRKELAQKFQCPVVSRYSNSENGFIAHQVTNEEEYLLNTASFFVEMLSLHGQEPVKDGEMGRIVVTDLFNFAMPFIRYDTGDVGVKGQDKNGNPVLKRIEGRRLDFIFDVNNKMLSPHVIDYAIRNSSDVRQFQLIQTAPGTYLLKLNVEQSTLFSSDAILRNLKGYLGESATISVEYVNEIPLLASGKRKIVVNAMSA